MNKLEFDDTFYKVKCFCIETPTSTISGAISQVFKGDVYICEGNRLASYYSVVGETTEGEKILFTSDLHGYRGKYCGVYDKKYFITLAEWRDKQINLILDEEG
jgi:hypothetical protein